MKAKISFGGAVNEASLFFCRDAKIGDYGLVHAGTVLEIVDEQRANEIIEALEREMK